ncbi:MAG: archease [Deltaproteobacteria bacterium]|nr:archease [Deltaproteobacteria bacterium]
MKARNSSLKTFKIIDHTGDMGIIVYGEDLKELFFNASRAFFSLITNLNRIRSTVDHTIVLKGENLDELMVSWLGELLYLFDAKGMLFRKFDIEEVNKYGLKATVRGEPFQPERHVFKRGIKAVTYHQVKVEKKGGKWEGRIIFDL